MLGPPGVGKGTQASILSALSGLPHISSGDLFRDNIRSGTALGKLAQSYIDRGELVPDEVTVSMVEERLARSDCNAGAILDGFPRTPGQARALDMMLERHGGQIAIVPYITAAPEVLAERIAGRWTCRAAGHIYHEISRPSKVAGKCDLDGSDLYQRDDDRPETIGRRIKVYSEQTLSLADYYRGQRKLVEIDGTLSVSAVTEKLAEALGMST